MTKANAERTVHVAFDVGNSPHTFQPIAVTGQEAMSELFCFDVELVADTSEVDLAGILEEEALLTIKGPDGTRRVHGIIGRFQQGESGQKYTRYTARLVPRVWRLLHGRDNRIFQNMSLKEIASQILSNAKVEHKLHCQPDPMMREYCVQYGESDWAFLSRLMEEEGFFYYFEHQQDEHLLHVGNASSLHRDIPGTSTVAYHKPEPLQAAKEHIYSLSFCEDVLPGAVSLQDYNFEKPTLGLQVAKLAERRMEIEIYDYPGRYSTPELGQDLARVQLEAQRAMRQKGEGQSTCLGFAPGFLYSLSDFTRSAANGLQYLLTRVQHQAETAGVDLDTGEGLDSACAYSNTFTCIPQDVVFRPEPRTPRPVMRGPQTAIVVGPPGEEIYTDALGRVKVQFHWDRQGRLDEKSSCWIRVSQGWAGARYGSLFHPRVGHEVVVDFIDGDPDRPLVVGRVYHGQNLPPYSQPEERTRSTVKSSSSPGGAGHNEIRFDDNAGKEELYTHAQKDQNEIIRNDMTTKVGNDQSIAVANDRTITVGGDEKIKIKGDQYIEVEGKRVVVVKKGQAGSTGNNHLTAISGDYKMTVSGTYTLDAAGAVLIKSGTSVKIEAPLITLSAAQIKLDGGEIDIDGDPIDVTGGDVTISGGVVDVKGKPIKLNCT